MTKIFLVKCGSELADTPTMDEYPTLESARDKIIEIATEEIKKGHSAHVTDYGDTLRVKIPFNPLDGVEYVTTYHIFRIDS